MRWLTIILAPMVVCLAAGCLASPDSSGVVAVRASHNFGSGVVVAHDAHGYLVATAAHVVHGDRWPLIDAQLGEVVAANEQTDVALVRVNDTGQGYHVRRMADRAYLGEPVTALAYTTHGLHTYRLCYRGHISALRWPGGVLAANCGVFPGMSGGPVLNSQGQIIGLMRGCQVLNGLLWETATLILPAQSVRALMRE